MSPTNCNSYKLGQPKGCPNLCIISQDNLRVVLGYGAYYACLLRAYATAHTNHTSTWGSAEPHDARIHIPGALQSPWYVGNVLGLCRAPCTLPRAACMMLCRASCMRSHIGSAEPMCDIANALGLCRAPMHLQAPHLGLWRAPDVF